MTSLIFYYRVLEVGQESVGFLPCLWAAGGAVEHLHGLLHPRLHAIPLPWCRWKLKIKYFVLLYIILSSHSLFT